MDTLTIVSLALAVTTVALALLVLWLLRPTVRRGGMLDHSAAAARGELDLDWSDPRTGT